MFGQTAGDLFLAIVILATMAVVLPIDRDLRPEFGDIDPAYRSAYSDTAWFVPQPGDDPRALMDIADDATPNQVALVK